MALPRADDFVRRNKKREPPLAENLGRSCQARPISIGLAVLEWLDLNHQFLIRENEEEIRGIGA